ncbi:hypothetical protein HZS_1548 [Henneguya salminicola]|nr:hypothetical protein HZS_1548 [Henneguya salminicola]
MGVGSLGGFADQPKNAFLLRFKNERKKLLLKKTIANVLPGSTIITGCWGYCTTMQDYDFPYMKENPSINFVDLQIVAYMETIEWTWCK